MFFFKNAFVVKFLEKSAVGQGDWQSFQFAATFDAPPVVVILSRGEGVPQNVEVRSITSTGFEALLEVPPGCTGGLPPVTVLCLALVRWYCVKISVIWVITRSRCRHIILLTMQFLWISIFRVRGCGFVTLAVFCGAHLQHVHGFDKCVLRGEQ